MNRTDIIKTSAIVDREKFIDNLFPIINCDNVAERFNLAARFK